MIVLLLNTDMRRRSPNWDFVCYVYQLDLLVEMIRRVSEPSDKNASVLLILKVVGVDDGDQHRGDGHLELSNSRKHKCLVN